VSAINDVIERSGLKMNVAIIYLLISVLGGAIGQLALKRGMNSFGELTLSMDKIVNVIMRMATNPYVVVGMVVYAASTVFWLAALSRVDLSFAYPFASLSYVVMLIGAWQLFDENISVMRLVGCVVVISGVLLISRS
jgi:multidrug transporter EmrE-like cation transporter